MHGCSESQVCSAGKHKQQVSTGEPSEILNITNANMQRKNCCDVKRTLHVQLYQICAMISFLFIFCCFSRHIYLFYYLSKLDSVFLENVCEIIPFSMWHHTGVAQNLVVF